MAVALAGPYASLHLAPDITMPAPTAQFFYRPDALPATQPTASKHCRNCNLSLMACFADINVSQGSVATYAKCDASFNIQLTTNLPRNFPVKKSLKIG